MSKTSKSDQRSPYFKMFPRDFFSSSSVARMDADEQGTYAILIFREWIDGFIPADLEELSDLLRVPLDVMERRWRRISRCFVEIEPGKLVNHRLEAERDEMRAKNEGSKRAIKTRWDRQKASKHEGTDVVRTYNGRSTDVVRTLYHADADADTDADVPSSDAYASPDGAENASRSDEERASAEDEQAGTGGATSPPSTPSVSRGQDGTPRARAERKVRPPKSQSLPGIQAKEPQPKVGSTEQPEGLPREWPEDVDGLKRLAVLFLAAFGNCRTRQAQAKHGPAYVDVLSRFRSRRGVTIEMAWKAFSEAVEAHEGKPMFGSMAHAALGYLRPNLTPLRPYQQPGQPAGRAGPQLVDLDALECAP